MIEIVLWDVDGTLLDFNAAEKAAIRTLFTEFDLGECTDTMLARYSEINTAFWKRLEKNELSREQVLLGRFEQFFGEYGIDARIAPAFNEKYQLSLGDTIVYRDDSLNIVKSLKGKVKQYTVSNGTIAAQTKKLERSKLGDLMDGIYLSEKLGIEKPNAGFFEKVFSDICPGDLSKVMIVGDSLTSDMQGGMNAGIKTCWYNPEKKPLPGNYHVDYIITDLHEVAALLDMQGIITYRIMTIDDYDKVYSLWMSCRNMGFNNLDDSREGIDQYLKRNPSSCFVALKGEDVIGVIFSGHDGRRGFIHHMAVSEEYRRQKIASNLLDRALSALEAEGIHKVALLVFQYNKAGNAFWESMGFTARDDVIYRNKGLTEMVRIDT